MAIIWVRSAVIRSHRSALIISDRDQNPRPARGADPTRDPTLGSKLTKLSFHVARRVVSHMGCQVVILFFLLILNFIAIVGIKH